MKDTIKKLVEDHPDTDFIVVSRGIDRSLHEDLTKLLEGRKDPKKSLHIFLTTYGGDPHGGYRVARCLRHYYDKVRLIVPSYCKSAGTMISIVADELVIGDSGELGPLDVQVTKPNEVQERGSGLDNMQALNACLNHAQEVFNQNFFSMRHQLRMSTKQAGELAGQIAAGLLAPLYSQIEPLRIGELQRAVQITLEYGKRLNAHSNNLRPNALDRLVFSYPAHGFVIDRKEAKDLFNKVLPMSPTEAELCRKMWDKIQYETGTGPLFLDPSEDSALGGVNESDDNKQQDTTASQKPKSTTHRRSTAHSS